MMLKNYFVEQSLKKMDIENFIKTVFAAESYSDIELERTPLGIKIIIYTNKPGRIIGSGGRKINEITDLLRIRFNLENPQIDVKVIRNPALDATIVAKQIASALERGFNYKKIGNLTLKRIMDAGAIGAEIIISGKLGGSKSRTGKFVAGYLKHCGQPAQDLVDYGFQEATTKPGKIGVKVKIMKEFMTITGEILKKEEMQKEVEIPEVIKEEELEAAETPGEGVEEKKKLKPKGIKKKKTKVKDKKKGKKNE